MVSVVPAWLLERHAFPSLTHLPSQLENHKKVIYGASTMSSSNRSQPHYVHFENLCIGVFCSCVLLIKAESGCQWHGAKEELAAVHKEEESSY